MAVMTVDHATWMWHDARLVSLVITWDDDAVTRCLTTRITEADFDPAVSDSSRAGQVAELRFGAVWDVQSTIPGFYSSRECIHTWQMDAVRQGDVIQSRVPWPAEQAARVLQRHHLTTSSGSVITIICHTAEVQWLPASPIPSPGPEWRAHP